MLLGRVGWGGRRPIAVCFETRYSLRVGPLYQPHHGDGARLTALHD